MFSLFFFRKCLLFLMSGRREFLWMKRKSVVKKFSTYESRNESKFQFQIICTVLKMSIYLAAKQFLKFSVVKSREIFLVLFCSVKFLCVVALDVIETLWRNSVSNNLDLEWICIQNIFNDVLNFFFHQCFDLWKFCVVSCQLK